MPKKIKIKIEFILQIHVLGWFAALIILLCHCVHGTAAKNQLCEVETGQTNIILDIEESRGRRKLCSVHCSLFSVRKYSPSLSIFIATVIDQRTTPTELPIFGDPFTEIALELVFPKGNQIFLLNGKSLQLLQPLDRDEENLSHIVFQVSAVSAVYL